MLRNFLTATARVSAELVLTAGFVLLLFAFYLLVWSNQRTAFAQDDLLADFRNQQGNGDSAPSVHRDPDPGEGVAVLHAPKLGTDWQWVVVEGTDMGDLRNGPGRFSDSAMPGEVGNFAIAGHRATHGEPFARFDEISEGDQFIVETADEWLVYEVTWEQIVPPTAVEVLSPVAGHPDMEATVPTMTLVTCHPRWGSTERLVVGSQLVERRTSAAGPPDALT